jgi:PLP dependent protein
MIMEATRDRIRTNLEIVRTRMANAARRVNRDPAAVQLVAVTKYARLEWVRELLALGQVELGENRPQQLAERAAQLNQGISWHLIGNLQRNKVRITLPLVTLIHAVDSLRLLEAISRIAGELQLTPRILFEVHLSGEESKHGFDLEELRHQWDAVLQIPHVQIAGLMTMAAYAEDPEMARPVFRQLRQLLEELRSRSPAPWNNGFRELSMGMTGDFEVAIEEGATLIRIGSALWEGLE